MEPKCYKDGIRAIDFTGDWCRLCGDGCHISSHADL